MLILLLLFLAGGLGGGIAIRAAENPAGSRGGPTQVITNAAAVRTLPPEAARMELPVRLRGVATYVFDAGNLFVLDKSAGIYVGDGAELPGLASGDLVEIEGRTSAGEFAPMVRPTKATVIGHTNLPPPLQVSYEDLVTGGYDSQWVEVPGLVRAVFNDPATGWVLEIASGSGRLTAFVPSSTQSRAASLVDSRVRLKGVCGTWFNKQRQLFGVRLMVPHEEDIIVEELASTNALAQPAEEIGSLMRFTANPSPYGRRAKVSGTVILHEPGRALYVQDETHGLYVQTRQSGRLHPGDRVELLGFPVKGEYTPMLQDGVWTKVSGGTEPIPELIKPDEALAGKLDSRLVAIEGRLLDRAHNNNEWVLVLQADNCIFSALMESEGWRASVMELQNGSRLRLTGVCRIEVGDTWRAGPAWRAKSFRVLLRSPADIQVLSLPPWWTLRRLLWAVGILMAAVLVSLAWAGQLRRKVRVQTAIIRQQLETEAGLKERYKDLFENANDMVYTHDLSGRLTSVNLAGEQLLGRSRDSIVGKMILDFVAPDQRQAAAQWLDHIPDGAAPPTVEWDFVDALGERVKLEISTRLIAREGRNVEVEGIARDVTEPRRLEKEILEISSREQRRIGHDLHDGVCQQLAGIGLLSDTLADRLQDQNRAEAAVARNLAELVNRVNRETRAVARGLFPVRLEENGLVSALEELAENAGTFFKTDCAFECSAPVVVRDHLMANHLYFIAREAILNAVKHGKASHIVVQLGESADDQHFLAVRNDGLPFIGSPERSRGMGIRIMKYRAKMIGATVQFQSLAGSGAEVICRFRCERRPEELTAASGRTKS